MNTNIKDDAMTQNQDQEPRNKSKQKTEYVTMLNLPLMTNIWANERMEDASIICFTGYIIFHCLNSRRQFK